jgi:hypothetical protein
MEVDSNMNEFKTGERFKEEGRLIFIGYFMAMQP